MPAFPITRSSTTRPARGGKNKTHYPRSGEPNPKVRFGVVASAGGAGPVGRSRRLFGRLVPDQRRRLVARQLGRLLLRAEPHPDLARPRQVHARRREGLGRRGCSAIRPRPGSRARGPSTGSTTARSSGSASATAGSTSTITTPAGTLKAQLTSGPWEVRGLEHVDSKDGWIYFTGTRDNPMATQPLSHQARRPDRAAHADGRQPQRRP